MEKKRHIYRGSLGEKRIGTRGAAGFARDFLQNPRKSEAAGPPRAAAAAFDVFGQESRLLLTFLVFAEEEGEHRWGRAGEWGWGQEVKEWVGLNKVLGRLKAN
ncbi:hypothetical protein KY290_007715 [Solanum tuberosum]|uniref:Uncharacterized protein n=1 Tax=Solanum tuberosum TaxID=4113 RepID=A0ABQ7W6H1_SOLTU|nr:hypothetical protein KY290_007715 [Solanum tuberosum]